MSLILIDKIPRKTLLQASLIGVLVISCLTLGMSIFTYGVATCTRETDGYYLVGFVYAAVFSFGLGIHNSRHALIS